MTKTFGHEAGLSCAFRQWRAKDTHCRFIHGYPLSFKFTIESGKLDERNWVFSFGGFKEIKKWLEENFDHKTVIAADDPELEVFKKLDKQGIIQLVVMPHVGCEKFAEHVYETWAWMFSDAGARLLSVEVREHGGNGATYMEKIV